MSEMVPTGVQPPSKQPPDWLIPQTPIMAGQTYASPMSFIGSARRCGAWAQKHSTNPLTAFLAWGAAVVAIVGVWWFLMGWYLIVFGLFGLFTIPFRLMRRGHRKSLAVQKQQLATMQAMMIQQHQSLKESAPKE